MDYQLTAIYHKVREGYVAFVEELPGASSQGATLEEARENLREAIEMVIDANRTISGQELGGAKVIREPIKVSA
jgi:predicted RNase H-like HicB family nuclease